MRTSLVLLLMMTAVAKAGDEAWLGESVAGFVNVNNEYLKTKSASKDLFQGKLARNIANELLANYSLMPQIMKEEGFDPLLDMIQSAEQFHVFILKEQKNEQYGYYSTGAVLFLRGTVDKAAAIAWADKHGEKLGFQRTVSMFEGLEVHVIKPEKARDGAAFVFVEGGVLFSTEELLPRFLKGKDKNITPAVLDAFKKHTENAVTVYYKDTSTRINYSNKPSSDGGKPEETRKEEKSEVFWQGQMAIDGGLVKGKLEIGLAGKELNELSKFGEEVNKYLPHLKTLPGVKLKLDGVSEKSVTVSLEADDTKWKDYLRYAFAPDVDPTKPVVKLEGKQADLKLSGAGRPTADGAGKYLGLTIYGEWGENAKPGGYVIVDPETFKVIARHDYPLDQATRSALYPSEFTLHSGAQRVYVRTYNHFSNSQVRGSSELLHWADFQPIKTMQIYGSVQFSPDGKWFLGSGGSDYQLYDSATGEPAGSIKSPNSYPMPVWSSDSKMIANQLEYYTDKSSLNIYDIAKKDLAYSIKLADDGVARFAWIGSDKIVLLARKSGKLMIWDLASGKAEKTLELPPTVSLMAQSIHPRKNGTFLISSGLGTMLEVDLEKGITKQYIVPVLGNRAVLLGDRMASNLGKHLVVWQVP